MTISSRIEAVLSVLASPVTVKKLAGALEVSSDELERGLEELESRLQERESAMTVQRAGEQLRLVTRPEFAGDVERFMKEDAAGELTRPSLETLTILAYRGPLTRPEIEQIRGVQSSLILRNLMIRGLVEEKGVGDLGLELYGLTMQSLQTLGVARVEDLPQYEELRGHSAIQDVLKDLEKDEVVGSPEPQG